MPPSALRHPARSQTAAECDIFVFKYLIRVTNFEPDNAGRIVDESEHVANGRHQATIVARANPIARFFVLFFIAPRPLVRRRAATSAKLVTKATRKVVRQAERSVRQAARTAKSLAVDAVRKAPGRFVEVEGARIHYIARGRGRPVVLLHGNGAMAEDFEICGLIDRLAARYRVIAIDRPGFGHSSRPRHRIWTASAQARLVHKVLEQLNVERPLIVGHSWGTLVAVALAAGEWRELRGLVLLSGYYYPSRRADVALSAPLAVPILGDAARSLMPAAFARTLATQSFRHVFRPQSVPARFMARFPVEIAMGATQMRASTEDAATMNAAADNLQRIYLRLRLPVAILTGDADAVVDAESQSGRLHREIAGSTLKVLPGLGHMIHYSARPWIGRAVDALMAPTQRTTVGLTASKRLVRDAFR